jgi:hypothetical protein
MIQRKEILLRSINDKNLLLDVFDSILDSNSIEINRKISISPLSDNQIDIYKNEVIDDFNWKLSINFRIPKKGLHTMKIM